MLVLVLTWLAEAARIIVGIACVITVIGFLIGLVMAVAFHNNAFLNLPFWITFLVGVQALVLRAVLLLCLWVLK